MYFMTKREEGRGTRPMPASREGDDDGATPDAADDGDDDDDGDEDDGGGEEERYGSKKDCTAAAERTTTVEGWSEPQYCGSRSLRIRPDLMNIRGAHI